MPAPPGYSPWEGMPRLIERVPLHDQPRRERSNLVLVQLAIEPIVAQHLAQTSVGNHAVVQLVWSWQSDHERCVSRSASAFAAVFCGRHGESVRIGCPD